MPTAIFDFLQETDDYYYPCFTGTYLRLIRQMVFLGAIFLTPVWYTLVVNEGYLPDWISFIVPKNTGEVPIIAQLLIVEFVLDGLKLASLNTPSVLSNSFSVVGGLLLGDFAVQIGWLCPDAIFYMAIEAIAGFTQSNYELGYAFKFMRIMLLVMVGFFGIVGFVIGTLLIVVIVASNKSVDGSRSYLYPLFPFNRKAFLRHIFRFKLKPQDPKNKK